MAFSANSFRTSTLLISKDTDHSPLPFFFSICTFSCTVVTHLEHLSSSSTRFKLLSDRRNLKKEGRKRKSFLLKFSFFHRIILKQEKKEPRKASTTREKNSWRAIHQRIHLSLLLSLRVILSNCTTIKRCPIFFLVFSRFIHFFQQFFSLFCFCFVHRAREKGTQ